MFSGTYALPENRGHMLTPEFGRSGWTCETGGPNRSDRCGQVSQNTIWTSPLDSSRRVDQDTYVEYQIRSPDERVMTMVRINLSQTG